MSNENKLKEVLNKEIDRALNKYNSAVFILNGGTTTEAKNRFGNNGPRLPAESLRRACQKVNPIAYEELKREAVWVTDEIRVEKGMNYYMSEPTLKMLRDNKHLFIGEP